MPDAFYEPAPEGGWTSTELTRGPWDPGAQHAGPPAALIGREVERLGGGCLASGEGAQAQVGRITFEVMRPVPIGPVAVSAAIVRPGRRVEMFEAELSGADGEALIRARGWRIRRDQVALPGECPGFGPPDDGPADGRPGSYFETSHEFGYHSAMEVRFIRGAFTEPGPATAWMRLGVELVAGEEPTPLQRVLAAADTGNGISSALDLSSHLFINVDLSVHLHRLPAGEWIRLDAITYPEATGVGLSDTALADEAGPLGRASQTLLIAERQ